MPFYTYRCAPCDAKTTVSRRVDDRNVLPPCRACGRGMTRLLVSPHLDPVFRTLAGREDRARRRHDDA